MWQSSWEEKTAGFMIKKERKANDARKRRSLTRDGIIIIYLPHTTTNDALERRDIRRHLFCFGFFSFLASLLPQTIISLWTIFGIPSYAQLMKAASSLRFIISFSFVDEGAEREREKGEEAEEEGHCTLKRPTCIQGHLVRERECADMGVFLLQKKKNMDDTTTVSTLTVCLFLFSSVFLIISLHFL